MGLIKLQICKVNLESKLKPRIFIKKVGDHRKRTLHYYPTPEDIKKLLSIFRIKDLGGLRGKIFQVPEEKSQTDLAFKFILNQGHLRCPFFIYKIY